MEFFHNVYFRAFIRNKDNIASFKNSLISLTAIPEEEFAKEKVIIDSVYVSDGVDDPFTLVTLNLQKKRHVNLFKESFLKTIPKKEVEIILDTLDSRVDDTCRLFLRFDLKEFLNGNLKLIDGEDCLHMTLSIAAYPKKREVSLEVVENYFKSL